MSGTARLFATIWALAFTIICVCVFLTRPLAAQTSATGAVTIFTDGLAYPDGVISKALAELSVEFEKLGKLRLLSIMGNAGTANVRDLLRFRGADFAILNSDVFASTETSKNFPEAGDKLRYVAKLQSHKAVLLGRGEINAVDQLAGKKVAVFGPDTVTGLTARAVFALLDVKAEITAFQEYGAEDQLRKAAAIFFFNTDAKRLPSIVARSGEFHPIAIPINAALSKYYRRAEIQRGELADLSGEDAVATIETDTILAAFNWVPQHGRYQDVTAFIESLFAALPRLRGNRPSSIWNETDPRAPVLGWRQYAPAAEAGKSVPATRQNPLVAAIPAFTSRVEDTGREQRLKLSIVPGPPLTDERSSGGGLLTELTKAALERTDWPHAANVEVLWDKDRASQTHGMLAEKRADLALPWSKPSCEDAELLTAESAALCDGALASEPIFKALVVFITTSDSHLDPTSEERLSGHTVCVPANRDVPPLTEKTKRMMRDGSLKLVRPPSMIDCLNVVGRGDADALLVNELEGKRAISDLGLSREFRVFENAGSAQEVRIIVAKHLPKAEELLGALNKGIAKLKSEELYSQIIMKYLVPLNRSATTN